MSKTVRKPDLIASIRRIEGSYNKKVDSGLRRDTRNYRHRRAQLIQADYALRIEG